MNVTTQAELVAALADKSVDTIDIISPAGVWLEINSSQGKSVSASGSASVSASGSASVSAFASASVRAYGSASVRAYGSASVRAFGSASVRAFGSASVSAFDSASVRAYGSASVRAFGSASVRAYGSASVRASDSASVSAYDSATVTASPYVAVHLHSARATVTGGVLIDITKLQRNTFDGWASYHGVEVIDDEAILYKAVDKDLKSERGFPYPIGETVTDPSWKPGNFCGSGLHFSPSPYQAHYYFPDATRFLKVAVKVTELSVINGDSSTTPKAKGKACRVLAEVDVHGRELAVGK